MAQSQQRQRQRQRSELQAADPNGAPHLIRIEERVELFDRHRAVGRVFVAAPRDADAPAL